MNNKELRMYVVIGLIFLMFFAICMDLLIKTENKISSMRKTIDHMNSELAEVDIIEKEIYEYLNILKQKQDTLSEIQDWQITDVNEQLVVLDQKMTSIGNQRVLLSNEEIKLFESLVMAEAGGESLECQRAVASVVINRILHERFPKTLNGVIYQKNAFSVVNDGSLAESEPTESVKEAVKLSLYKDYTNNAISFLNVDLAIKQGYRNNVNDMLDAYEIDLIIDNVTFLKEK